MQKKEDIMSKLREINDGIKPYKEIIWLVGLIIISAYILIDYNNTCSAAIEGYNYAEAKYGISDQIAQKKAENNGELVINVEELRKEALQEGFFDTKSCQVEAEKARYSLKRCIIKLCELEEDCNTEEELNDFKDDWENVKDTNIPVPIVNAPS